MRFVCNQGTETLLLKIRIHGQIIKGGLIRSIGERTSESYQTISCIQKDHGVTVRKCQAMAFGRIMGHANCFQNAGQVLPVNISAIGLYSYIHFANLKCVCCR